MLLLFYPLKSYQHSALRDSCLKTSAIYGGLPVLNCKSTKSFDNNKEMGEKTAFRQFLASSLPPPS